MMTPLFLDGYMLQFSEEEFAQMHTHRWQEIAKIQDKLEFIRCPLCKCEAVGVLVEVENEGALGRCKECHLVYSYHRPVTEVLRYFYLYYTPTSLTSIETRTENAKTRPLQLNYDLDHIECFIPRGRILDVGCASGDFLVYARSRGWQVEGTELSVTCKQFVEQTMGIIVNYGNILEIDFDEVEHSLKEFDAIALRHSVEHLAYPIDELLALRARLSDDGVLFITTPEHAKDLDMVSEHHMLPLHLVNYTKETLELLLEKSGFRMVSYTPIPAGHFTTNETNIDCMMVVAVKA